MPYNKKKKPCTQSDGDKGKYVLSYVDKKGKEHNNCHTSKEKMQGQIAAIEGLDEDRPGSSTYYTGTKKSNKQMAGEIKKCAKKPRPKSCYKDWSADKTYRQSTKSANEAKLNEMIRSIILDEKKKRATLSKKTKKALKNKADKSNAPAGVLYSVYRRGLAAWLTGHRQGVAQHQWAMGRVNSFISGKGGARKADSDLWDKVKKHRSKSRKDESVMSSALLYHNTHGKGIDENIFRPGSDAFFELFNEARQLFREGKYSLSEAEAEILLGSDLGEFAMYEGEMVPLDFPMMYENDLDEAEYKGRKVKLGAKGAQKTDGGKSYVYVRNPKNGKVKKVTFGSSMADAMGDSKEHRKRRKSFGDRHECSKKENKLAPGYWACRATKMFGRNISGWW